jgi:hypothetical protein
LEPEDLAGRLLELNRSGLAVSQIWSFGRVLVPDQVALRFAVELLDYSSERGRRELQDLSLRIYQQAKPVGFLHQSVSIDAVRQHDSLETLRAWAAVAPLFEDANDIVAQTKQLQFAEPATGEPNESALKADLLLAALQTAVNFEMPIEVCTSLLVGLEEIGESAFDFAGSLIVYRLHPSAELLERLGKVYATVGLNSDMQLRFAKVLYDVGCTEKARNIISSLKHIRFDYFQSRHVLGFSDVTYTVMLRCLQELLDLEEGVLPSIKDDRDEAIARIEVASRRLGISFARVLAGKPIVNLREMYRSILLFHNRPLVFDEYDRHQNYVVAQSKSQIYGQLVELAILIGENGIEALRDEFLEIVQGPAGAQFTPEYRRQFAAVFFRAGLSDRQAASTLALSSEIDTMDDDPVQRQRACLDIAQFFQEIGDDDAVEGWLNRASEVSAGAGSHKDYHMAQLAEWMGESIGMTLDNQKLEVVDNFFRALEVAGGAGTSSAATQLLQSVLAIEPQRGVSLAIELIDRDVLNVSQTLEAILIGSQRAAASPSLLMALYCELLSLIHPGNTSTSALATLRAFPPTERIPTARALLMSVRTNSLPSHRVQVARAIQDALREDGLGEVDLSAGLKPGADDSSETSTLYKSSAGELLTVDRVATLLSSADQQTQWNPNSPENGNFDWWRAIKKAKIR